MIICKLINDCCKIYMYALPRMKHARFKYHELA